MVVASFLASYISELAATNLMFLFSRVVFGSVLLDILWVFAVVGLGCAVF